MADAGIERLPDFLVVGQEDWDEIERRNQLLVRALAARHPRARFLFVELPVRPRRLLRARRPRPRPVAEGVWALRPIRPLPDRLGARVNDRLEALQLRRALRRLALERPALWTQDSRALGLVDHLDVGKVVFDLTDDWAAFEDDAARRSAVDRRIRTLARRADAVLACSRALEEQARTWGTDPVYVPNAVALGARGAAPSALAALPRPRLGYVGTLHDARLDVGLVADAAARWPEASFVLLGPDLLSEASRARLDALANVHLLPPLPHAELRRALDALDAGLVPHRVTDFTRSLDPLKVYEYLAAGLPVVSTPVGVAPELAAYVRVADGAGELVAASRAAIADSRPEERRAAVAGASWDARASDVERALGVEPGAPASRPDVSVVVVSFETRELLARCLAGVAAQRGVAVETIVVDNGSRDGSVELVRERFPGVRLLEAGSNLGFGPANNLGFAHARGEHVLLLNSDAYLEPGGLAALVDALRRHPEAAAVGPRLLNEDGTLQRSAWPFPRPARLLAESVLAHRPLRRLGLIEDLGTWAHDEERAVDFLVGACLLVRREALAEVGGFDEDFWLYGEEADLCRRLARRGWNVVLAPGAECVHVGGASSAGSSVRLRHFYRGQKTFLRKHGGVGAWPLARLALLVGALLRGRLRVARLALDPRL